MNKEKRLKDLEERASALRRNRIDPADRLITFFCYAKDDDKQLVEERMSRMREKYSPDITEADFDITIFRIRYVTKKLIRDGDQTREIISYSDTRAG